MPNKTEGGARFLGGQVARSVPSNLFTTSALARHRTRTVSFIIEGAAPLLQES